MTVDMIHALKTYMRRFVESANRLIENNPGYEPPLDKSHIWAELVSTVEHANDTLEDIES